MTNAAEQQPQKTRDALLSNEQPARPETWRHVEIWVRGEPQHCVSEAKKSICEEVDEIREADVIHSFDVHHWSNVTETSGTATTSHETICRETITAFENWADEHGYTLEPAFQTRNVSSLVTERERSVLVPPILSLAVYDGDGLRAVFPSADERGVHTVADGLEHLRSGIDKFQSGDPDA